MSAKTPKPIEKYIVELWASQGVQSPKMISTLVKRNKDFYVSRRLVYTVLKRNGIDIKEKYGK